MDTKVLCIPFWLWGSLVPELRRRGKGVRESGAFLLGVRGLRNDGVKAYACYDDLEPTALDSGIIIIGAAGYARLWALCRSTGLEVLADVHTHPGPCFQSTIDSAHPMVPEPGHVALIIADFAEGWNWRMARLGVYEYLGGHLWKNWTGAAKGRRTKFSLW
jgi:proteasome lid subunit RPN8/RPN11